MISVLYAHKDSVYKSIAGCDVWDEDRDARRYNGPNPVVAHPPCRLWGRMRGLSTADPSEMATGVHAIEQVLKWGGVLEHPKFSLLIRDWIALLDRESVQIIEVSMLWFGFPAEKKTWIMVAGLVGEMPEIPFRLAYPTHVVTTQKRDGRQLPDIAGKSKGRSATPIAMAEWLVSVASKCRGQHAMQ